MTQGAERREQSKVRDERKRSKTSAKMGGIASKKQSKVLVIGLDNSGKSTIINSLKPTSQQQHTEMNATVGFLIEKFSNRNIAFTMFDMSGSGRYRNLWQHYYEECDAVIYVIDSSDSLRLCVNKDELQSFFNHNAIQKKSKNLPILFYANKSDLPQALSVEQISNALELNAIKQHPWHIQSSNAKSGEGIQDGLSWLTEHVKG